MTQPGQSALTPPGHAAQLPPQATAPSHRPQPSPARALGLSVHTATSRGSALRPLSVIRSQICVCVHSR